jgi:outer membrane receptor for ferrienterochelin and colicins
MSIAPCPRRVVAIACAALGVSLQALAQTEPTPVPPPAPAASAPGRPAGQPPGQRVEITGGRLADDESRRQSTAAKIVIGREEIDKFGDATVGEVLRRLPGVTTPGAPGRGGPPRMRGLGGGFTQLLIDGQRLPPGFSLDSLTPEQIERIEILRAPTAETGARAIAGTINIITREGFRRRLNDLRLGFGYENGQFTPGLFWTHNDSTDRLTYNLSGSVFRPWRDSSGRVDTVTTRLSDGAVVRDDTETSQSQDRRRGVNLSSRLQWRLGETGDMLLLMPSVFHNEGRSNRQFQLTQRVALPASDDYERGTSASSSRTTATRLNTQWRQRLGIGRIELQGGVGQFESHNGSHREELAGSSATPLRQVDDRSDVRDRSANITVKLSSLLGGEGSEHSLVTGFEAEALRRTESRTTLQNGQPLLTDFGDNLRASSTRYAAYAQDEWALNKHWAFHAGLRWEGITTRGEAENGVTPENDSSVWTPLVHLLWKPDPAKRDQVRLSLTRSYRAPALGTLIARPSLNQRDPAPGPNASTTPDSAGNPALRPELARGVDLAFERYLEGGGVLSVNLFHRQIQNLMRRVVALESVSWAPVPRYVARQQNVGDATTQGLELEAKFRLDQAVAGAPPVELKSNLSLYRSRVAGVPGPDNRLDSQAKATANLGADYRFRGTPLTLGGNLNWVPGYRTQLSPDQAVTVSRKRVIDAYGLWTFSPSVALRVLASNLAPEDYFSASIVDSDGLCAAATTTTPSDINWQLRLELKL